MHVPEGRVREVPPFARTEPLTSMRHRRPDTLDVDGLRFAVRWSPRRRTIGITVERDGRLRVAAPARCPVRELDGAVRAKLPWVRRKLAEQAALGPPPAPPEYADGERLPYLGRTYRLALVDDLVGDSGGTPADAPVRLRRGRIEVPRAAADRRAAVVAWYTARAQALIARRVARFAPAVGVSPAAVVVRDLGKRRWGVCATRTGTLSFHYELVLLPVAIVDYVVVHELAHLHRGDHSPAFWSEVERVVPDWRARRRRLACHGQRHVV